MKRIIDGKIYNTETATVIANNCTSGLSVNDFNYFSETLFKTKKGTFFLAGKGHGMTRWATHTGNSSGWGEGIEVLTIEEARDWCERAKIDTDIVEQHFTIEEG